MEAQALLDLSLREGLFAALFVFAFLFILGEMGEGRKREAAQRDLYADFSTTLKEAKSRITSIEGKIERIDNKQSNISEDIVAVKYAISSMESIMRMKMVKKE